MGVIPADPQAPPARRPRPDEPTSSRRVWRRSFAGVSLASRLAATVLVVGAASLVVATVVGLNAGQDLGRRLVRDTLVLQRAAGANDVAAQARHFLRLAEQMAAGPTATFALEGFADAFEELTQTPVAETREQRARLLEVYGDRYLVPLQADGQAVEISDVLSDDAAAVYLQATYSLTSGPIGEPIAVDDAFDGSQWSSVHAIVHPTYRNAVLQSSLRDVYLIDARTDRIVYTAAKGPDLGTNLVVGPYSGSVIGRASDSAAQRQGGVLTDLTFYRAAPGVPIGAAAAPVIDDGDVIGTLVLTYDADVYTQRLGDLYEATAPGTRSGDLFIIGSDGTTRSDPQAYLADPQGFTSASVAAGVLTPSAEAEIQRNGTTVLVQPAADAVTTAARDGNRGIETSSNMVGAPTVSTVAPVPVDDVEWYAASELSVEVADSTVVTFRQILLVGTAAFVILLAFLGVAWARRIMFPVRVISDRLARSATAGAVTASPEPLTIPERSPREFHRLANSFELMEQGLARQQDELRRARAERLDVLKSMLPSSVAQRIARGDVESLEEVPSATVVVVVVLGLGALVSSGSSRDRILLDQLHAELDDLALEQGLERIKVVGDSYFAACGHDRPFMDHAPRSVAFAGRVAQAVRSLSVRSGVQLDTAIGINTGPVTVGTSAGTRLVYDVWGATVTVAHDLARSARAGEILVTEGTRTRLPDEVELAPRPDRPAELQPAGGNAPGPWVVVSGEGHGAGGGSDR